MQPTAKMPAAPSDLSKPLVKSKPPREKKDSWKKKEAAAAAAAAANAPGSAPPTGGAGDAQSASAPVQGMPPPALQRWRLPKPQDADYRGARPPVMTPSNVPGGDIGVEFFALSEHPKNRRGFRYVPCEASHILPLVAYRMTEVPPFIPRFNFEDMNAQVHVNRTVTVITTEKGFRMARGNVGVREGNWYYECKILRGIGSGGDAHCRVGWARREAPLDAPVGFDAYSYGLRDQDGQKLHMSRPTDFMQESLVTGDVIGLQICLPPISVQRNELLSSITNPSSCAVAASILQSGDVIRDRIPIRYKNQLYFEQFEYQPTKEMDELLNPSTTSAASASNITSSSKSANSIIAKTLPGSFIRVYKNGKLMGTPWENLYAFLPPCSKPNSAVGGRELDDGFLGYYPAVSVFRGGAVEVNFGPEWWFPPQPEGQGTEAPPAAVTAVETERNGVLGTEMPRLRPVCERYDEQIAEDILYDLVDEVDSFFTLDLVGLSGGGAGSGVSSGGGEGTAGDATPSGGTGGGTEEIKEMEVEEE
ncbi:hypothetical protein BDZ91DRAFT_688288 [Kalaharituber pfeilii]|nr:hypothetical protein BDZ91DRAFT_688288 [Kalaharituber pfeilii]